MDGPEWSSEINPEVTCKSFENEHGFPDVSACLQYGHEKSKRDINATTACCS